MVERQLFTQDPKCHVGGGLSHSPWADPHQWNWEAGEEDGAKEKGFPPPHVRQSTYERGTQEREQALEKKGNSQIYHVIPKYRYSYFVNVPVHFIGPQTDFETFNANCQKNSNKISKHAVRKGVKG